MITKLAFVEIIVNDFDQALEWYQDILGFELDSEIIENKDGMWCLLRTSTDDARVALWKPPYIADQCDKEAMPFQVVFEVEDLPKSAKSLSKKGVKFLEEIREMPKYRITTIEDIEGNQLQLYENLDL